MINPCDNCVVDAMCLTPCNKFIDLITEFKLYHPSFFLCQLYNLVNTETRTKRSRNCVFYNMLDYNLYSKLKDFRMRLLLQRKELII